MKRVLPMIVACCSLVIYAVYDAHKPTQEDQLYALTEAVPVTAESILQ